MIQVIPAIDLIGGRCVRLTQGDYGRQRSYDAEPVDMAQQYAAAGLTRLHLVDLDGARLGRPANLDTLRAIVAATTLTIEWGGGIRTADDLQAVLDAGAHCAIVGSVAVRQPDLMHQWLQRFGGDRIILGADVSHGRVAVSGWQESTAATIDELLNAFKPDGLRQCIVTDITRDGMLSGPNDGLYTALVAQHPDIVFTVSGGISSADDLRRLDAFGLPRVIVGKAIYEGRITLGELAAFTSNTAVL